MNEAKKMLDNWLVEQDFKTYKELADFLGVAQNTLDVWKQRGKIPEKNILKYTHLAQNLDQTNIADNKTDQTSSYNIRKITSVKASAGGGNELAGITAYNTGELMPIAKSFFKAPPGRDVCAIEVEGESMMPVLKPGDWVIFSEDERFKGDGLYVVNFSDQLMVKMLQLTPKGLLRIVSANKDYQSYELDINETQETCRIVGKVIKSLV